MARLLAYTSPAQGHVYPPVPMLLELQARGHQLQLRTQASEVERVRAAGLDASPADPRIEQLEIDDWKARTQTGGTYRLLRTFGERAKLEVQELRDAIAQLQPDALIIDINCMGAAYVAESSGLPWAHYCPYPPPMRSVDAPAWGLAARPPKGPLGRARDRSMWAINDLFAGALLKPLNQLRSELDLTPVTKYDEQFLKADRFIAFTAEPYEYPRSDWPASVRLVGPAEWGPPGEAPDWLLAETRPIVLVTASTQQQGDAKLIATALEAFAGEDLAVIATTAAQDPADFDAPDNAHVARFLPHDPIIQRAACVVSHGGQGTTQKALAAGVPVCVVPFCRDQFEVARRVITCDAGVRLHHRRLNPARLRAAVREAIAKRAGAQRVASAFAAAGGPAGAADAVEEILAAEPAPPQRRRSAIVS
jgi:MGT family glycosyltransferase